MEFRSVEVVKTKNNMFYVEWDMNVTDPGNESVDDYKFQIVYSFDPSSGFLTVSHNDGSPVEIDGAIGPLVYEHPLLQYDFSKDRYYKVVAIQKINESAQFQSEMVFIGQYSDGVHEVMRYAEETQYEMYSGEPCLIIKRKSFGTRCPECWSKERQQRTKSHCNTCAGTGFVTGYYQPISAQVAFDSTPKKLDLQKGWEDVYNVMRARMTNYPLVRGRDLIINLDDNKRYVIKHVETTKLPRLSTPNRMSRQNYILSQILTLQELNPDDNEYRIDIDGIPEIPQSDDGGSGSPVFSTHPPVTASPPIVVEQNQHLTFSFDTSDFEVIDGVFTLKRRENLDMFIAGEAITSPLTVVSINDSGSVVVGDNTDTSQVNRIVGVAINTAGVGEQVMVQKRGRLSSGLWGWDVGKGIFINHTGVLTQNVPAGGFFQKLARPVSATEIEIELHDSIIRA